MSAPPSIWLTGTARIRDKRIFGPLSIEAEAGRWTCLLGPSGVGKSTLLRLFAGLDQGIDFTGHIGAGDGGPLLGRTGMMAQSDHLLPWLDVIGNVCLGARLRGERPDLAVARRLAARVGLSDHVGKRPSQLSGGQRQRAALARTLMEDRPVLLLDEPFSALDARTRARMQDLVTRIFRGRTVLLVTHDAAEAARLGDRIVVMTEAGLQDVAPPPAPPVRGFDAPETLACQGRLMRLLMDAA